MIKVVAIKEDGEVKLTKEELEEMLNQAYKEGYAEGNKSNWTYYPATIPLDYKPRDWDKVTCKDYTIKGDGTYDNHLTTGSCRNFDPNVVVTCKG